MFSTASVRLASSDKNNATASLSWKKRDYLSNPTTDNISWLVKYLNSFCCDQGIVTWRGNIDKCDMYDYEVTHLILFIPKHSLTRLLILDFHAKCNHLGVTSTVRLSGFWLPRARQAIKTYFSVYIVQKI